MPVHNRFNFVHEAIESVYSQGYRPIELIVVDDLSDDPYVPKIACQPGFEIKVVRHEHNKGPGASRETGRLDATGEFVAYLDSDDLWHPQKLEKQVKMLQDHPEAGMCYSQSVEFSNLPLTGSEPLRKYSDQNFTSFLPIILSCRPWGTSACLWTRKAIEIIGPWFAGWAREDYEYELRAGCSDIGIIYIPEILTFYRKNQDEESLSNRQRRRSVKEQSPSLIQMNRDLNLSKKIDSVEIRTRFSKNLYNQSLSLFEIQEKALGKTMLAELCDISVKPQKKIFLSLLTASYILPSGLLYFLMKKIKHYLNLFPVLK